LPSVLSELLDFRHVNMDFKQVRLIPNELFLSVRAGFKKSGGLCDSEPIFFYR
jgi:hypothetical protein